MKFEIQEQKYNNIKEQYETLRTHVINVLKTNQYIKIKMPNGNKFKLYPNGKITKIIKKY